VAGSHDLVLHARVAGYEPAWCDLLYERRELFEATNKALSLVLASEFPWFRLGFGRKGPRFHARILAENAAVAERVLGRIRTEGVLPALDFEPEHGAPKDWFGMPENIARAVLEAYTVTGVLGLARRDGNLRYYDLLERLLPAELLGREVPVREQLRHKLLSPYRAHGLLGAGGAGGTFDRIAPPNSTPERPGRNALREELVELGALVPVDVEGVRGKRFVLGEELALLQAPPEPTRPRSRSSPRSILCCGTTPSSRACSASTTCGRGFSRRQNAAGAGTCSRSPSATASSAGSSRESIGTEPAWMCLTSGGRMGSRRAAPTGSSTRCATRSARTCASRARAASSGHPTSPRRSGSFSSALDRTKPLLDPTAASGKP
jgi:Winged helix DNA-binding domain